MNNKFKVLTINFKTQHKPLYEWLKEYCNSEGLTLSHVVRELISQFKKDVEAKKDE